ncbi:MAG TPA: aminotransferase class I/II-fold pyridoxal phosphate-dependent enzyme [Chthonomonadales bacterium]|nr:aminotransferase class I/II-fold pyridoxal phosphate-dependent enzyme [Chthonomonadales bacterium]
MVANRLAIDGGTPAIPEPIPSAPGGLGVQCIDDAEIEAVTELLRAGQLFRHSPGSRVRAFEREAAAWLGVDHALMVNTGTSALVCGLAGMGIGPGDEVIVPAYTYIATAAAVVAVGAVPVLAEIDESLGLDPADLEAKVTPSTKAVIPVYMQGVPARIAAILEVARRHRLKVLEDCCQCIGGEYRGRRVGALGDAGAWSLNYFKILTCGEGGLVFTNDYPVYERACFASDPALPMWMKGTTEQEGWETEPFSANCFRPSELLGGLALVQLGKLDAMLAHTRTLKRAFLAALEEPRGYRPQHVDDPDGDCGISAAILVHDAQAARRYGEALSAEGLPCGTAHNEGFPDRHIYVYWDSILGRHSHHPAASVWDHPAYSGSVAYSGDACPQTIDILNRSLRFGFNMRMTREHACQMAAAINKVDAALA